MPWYIPLVIAIALGVGLFIEEAARRAGNIPTCFFDTIAGLPIMGAFVLVYFALAWWQF